MLTIDSSILQFTITSNRTSNIAAWSQDILHEIKAHTSSSFPLLSSHCLCSPHPPLWLIGLGLQLRQFAGDKVPLERHLLAPPSEGHVLREAVVAASSFISSSTSGLLRGNLPILALLPLSHRCPFLILDICQRCLICCSSSSSGCSGLRLLFSRPISCKTIPESCALVWWRSFFWFYCKWTEN